MSVKGAGGAQEHLPRKHLPNKGDRANLLGL